MNSTASGISGKVVDLATTQGIPFATVVVSVDGVRKGGATTDMDGKFRIKPLDPGFYSLEATCTGYQPAELKKINVAPGQVADIEIPMVEINPS